MTKMIIGDNRNYPHKILELSRVTFEVINNSFEQYVLKFTWEHVDTAYKFL